jgi:hypothetical protein
LSDFEPGMNLGRVAVAELPDTLLGSYTLP